VYNPHHAYSGDNRPSGCRRNGKALGNIGLYAEVGYEWIDEPTVRNGGMLAEIDYSSLIVSTGLILKF
jgi:hypothetical protein